MLEDNTVKLANAIDQCCPCEGVTPIDTATNKEELSEVDRLRDSMGGKTGVITITLVWKTIDDLDLSLEEPDGTVISFRNKISHSGGQLDIDKNVSELIRNPIENIFYENDPPRGTYYIRVNLYNRNSDKRNIPYEVYVTINGSIKKITRDVSRENKNDLVYRFDYP
jgi:uncharacterized protein YfaP (DUF2135 family)